MQYKVALVIGRFQPFHIGHLYLIKKALVVADHLVIGIGSTNISDFDNPYSFEQRLRMLQDILKKAHLEKFITKIVGIPDNPDDQAWFEDTLKRVGKVNVVLGNNNWANYKFKDAGYEVIEVPFFKREIYEGKKIRAQMRKEGLL